MPRPWTELDSVQTENGRLSLRQRGETDFMILLENQVLMTSMITTSELELARLGCAKLASRKRPRVLIGGLGLGFTLRAALDALPETALVDVAELNPRVVDWCRGPAAGASGGAALDSRCRVIVGDVARVIAEVAADTQRPRYDAILWDLYVGPTAQGGDDHPLYGQDSVIRTLSALRDDGVFGVWGEGPSPAFEGRLRAAGARTELVRTRGGGLHHAVFLATRGGAPAQPAGQRREGHTKRRKR